jgi:L-asparaginase / beta-aspartyl-peptidase
MISHGIVVHGGVGSSIRLNNICKTICSKAFVVLEKRGSALDAAVEAVRLFENDGRFNAGVGSVLRLDGRTVEMDASVMESTGRLGAVLAVRDIRNPVLLAKRILDTPHVALAGEGASLLARKLGLEPSGSLPKRVLENYQKVRQSLSIEHPSGVDPRWDFASVERFWNFTTSHNDVFSCDTVGAVALDQDGRFATASSTGGASPMLLGRVGDTAFVGSGFYAGPDGAVVVTGMGEEILRKMLAKTVYDLILEDGNPEGACKQGLLLFPEKVPIGIVAISRTGQGLSANRPMATGVLVREA